MARIEERVCDICGTVRRSDSNGHWSDVIEPIKISFRNHSGCQKEPFEGDVCTHCVNKINNAIKHVIHDLSPQPIKEK